MVPYREVLFCSASVIYPCTEEDVHANLLKHARAVVVTKHINKILLSTDDNLGHAVLPCRYMCLWSDLCQWHLHPICQSWADFANQA